MSRARGDENPDAKLYVGDLTFPATSRDLEEAFSYYGPIKYAWVARNPPGFAFIEFEDPRDAEDAVKDTEGSRQYSRRMVCGRKVRIELCRRSRKSNYYPERRRSVGRSNGSDTRCFNCGIYGHFARDCRKRRRSHSRSTSRTRGDRRSPYSRRDRRSSSPRRRRSTSRSRPDKRSASRSSRSSSGSRGRSSSVVRDRRDRRKNSRSRTRSPSYDKKDIRKSSSASVSPKKYSKTEDSKGTQNGSDD